MKHSIIIIALLCQSCLNSLPLVISQAEYEAIPYDTKAIQIKTAINTDSLYTIILKQYAELGCPITSNKEALQIICDGMPTEHSGTIHAITNITASLQGAVATIRGQSQLSASQANNVRIISGISSYQAGKVPIIFLKKSGNKNYYFQHLLILANNIPGTINYSAK